VGERVGTEEVTVVAARKKRAMREPDRWSLRSGRAGRRNRQAPGPGLVGYVIGHVDQPLIEAGPEACWPRLGLIHSHGRRVGETGKKTVDVDVATWQKTVDVAGKPRGSVGRIRSYTFNGVS
jgi:hypothetical protein